MLDIPFDFLVEVVHREKSALLVVVRKVGQAIEMHMPSREEDAYDLKRWLLSELLRHNVAFVTRED